MSTCEIHLDNYRGVYSTGTEIKGRLDCHFGDTTTVRGIRIRLKCKEYPGSTITEDYRDPVENRTKSRYKPLAEGHDIWSVEQVVCGPGKIERGRHFYPFTIALPEGIPSTFNDSRGCVTYTLKGTIDLPFMVDTVDEMIVNVMSLIDFNTMAPSLQDPKTYSASGNSCLSLCLGGSISMEVEVTRLALVPGEMVPLRVHVSNMSNWNVRSLMVKLSKQFTIHTNDRKTIIRPPTNVVKLQRLGVGAHSEHTYNLILEIPDDFVVYNFTKCKYFHHFYYLQVECVMPFYMPNVGFCEPNILIGDIQRDSVVTNAVGARGDVSLPEIQPLFNEHEQEVMNKSGNVK